MDSSADFNIFSVVFQGDLQRDKLRTRKHQLLEWLHYTCHSFHLVKVSITTQIETEVHMHHISGEGDPWLSES